MVGSFSLPNYIFLLWGHLDANREDYTLSVATQPELPIRRSPNSSKNQLGDPNSEKRRKVKREQVWFLELSSHAGAHGRVRTHGCRENERETKTRLQHQ